MLNLEPIKLGYTSYEDLVDETTMQQIKALLRGNTYCRHCRTKFTQKKLPEVCKNTCLGCFLLRHKELEFTGEVWQDNKGELQYVFLDTRGHITLTSPDSDERNKQESAWATLKYHGFTWPETVRVAGKAVALNNWDWFSVYSKPSRFAVVAAYRPGFDAKHLLFLLKKNGECLLLDRRLPKVRALLDAAKAQIVAGNGCQEVRERGSMDNPTDFDMYLQLAFMVSQEHERQQQSSAEATSENPAAADIFFLSEDTPQRRIRFLIDFDDPRAVAIPWHKNYEEKIDRPCLGQFSMECEDCASSNRKTRSDEDIFVWPCWDYEAQRVRLVAARENSFTLVGKLFEYFEERGSILGRDFVVKRVKDESTKFPKMTLVPEDPSEFQFADDAYIPSADTLLKTMILARDPELAAELGISADERLGVLAESVGKGRAKQASAPAKTNAPSFRKRFNAEHSGGASLWKSD